ncbi:Uncharacterized protein FWK35_00026542 [Aphis craccivora]|uniref:Uncharacterized protein n=1 Tax=Aphis craccivora TaxID=307492 RepID=A0A6G0YQW5_APHCR|nr:Uncharacterized protein FWK35_00026542 [Aphis craccivora]
MLYTNSERSDECIDLTMLKCRNNARISNFGGGFRFVIESSWCIGEVILSFTIVFKSAGKNQKKITEKREFLRKTSFRPNRFFYMVVIQKLIALFIDQ